MRYFEMVTSGFAIHRVVVPIVNVPHGIQVGTAEQAAQAKLDGNPEPIECGIRVLSPGDDIEVDRLAEEFCKSKGIEKYDDIHPICVKARIVFTLAMACVDPDSDPHRPVLFWGDTVEQAADNIRSDPKRCMSDDTPIYLYERYLIWKDRVNPQANTVSDSKLEQMANKAASELDFLALLSPGMRLNFTHILAVQHVALVAQNAELISALEVASARSAKKSPSVKNKPQKAKPIVKARRR